MAADRGIDEAYRDVQDKELYPEQDSEFLGTYAPSI